MCIVLVNIKPNVLSMPTFCYPTFLLRSLQTWVDNTDYMAAWFFSTKISIIPPSTIFCAFCGEKMVPAHFKNYDRNVGRGLSVAWIMVNVWKQKQHIFRIQVTFSVHTYLGIYTLEATCWRELIWFLFSICHKSSLGDLITKTITYVACM